MKTIVIISILILTGCGTNPHSNEVIVEKHDTVTVYSNTEDEKRRDSLVWEIEKRDDKLVYNHNLIAKLINDKNELLLKVDSFSKSDIYKWVQQHRAVKDSMY